MRTNMSDHVRYDRKNRLEAIIDLVGIGDIIVKCDSERNDFREECLTSTGVCIIRDKNTKRIITAYIASLGKARRIYEIAYGYTEMPHSIFETVRANQKYANAINHADCF